MMGNGDKANGKLMVETLIENNTIGGNFIKYGFDLNIFIGKPNKIIGDLCIKKSGFTKEETLVIGDRLYTDIACGINSNIDTALVLTGEAKKEDIETTIFKPEYIFKNIKELYEKIIKII